MIHISITAEKIGEIGILPITNSILTTWLVMFFLICCSLFIKFRLTYVPGYAQLIAEGLIGGIYNLFHSITGEKTKIYFPLIGSLFIYIIFMNWAGLLPGVGSIGIYEIIEGEKRLVPLFRSGSADLNLTLALAFVSVVAIQFFGLRYLGLTYIKKFINFKNPIYFFVGFLDIIGEASRLVSFAFRLFGNIFAGEVLLTVIAFLMPLFAPLPFIGLEFFVGFIQALVFSMLTAVFLSAATSGEH